MVSDNLVLTYYFGVNSFIWTKSAFTWCFVPKVVWATALLQIHTDRLLTMTLLLLITSLVNFAQIICSREMVLALNFKVEQVVGHCDTYGVVDVFTMINLDFTFVCKVILLNLRDLGKVKSKKA